MKNYEMVRNLKPEELAWFLMAQVEHCRCCVYKQVSESGKFTYSEDSCVNCNEELRDRDGGTCISGYTEWLQRECETIDDVHMFAVCRHNVIVERFNDLPPEQRADFEIEYDKNHNAVGLKRKDGRSIEEIKWKDGEWTTPYSF